MSSMRCGSVLAGLATAVAFAVAAPAAAAAPSGSQAAASYLTDRLVADEHLLTTSFSGNAYPDHGLSADAVLALASAKTSGDERQEAVSAFIDALPSYVGDGTEGYVGATAKALLVVASQGRDARSVAGRNLVSGLTSLKAANGRFSDSSAYGDNSNTFAQALAVVALVKAGVPADARSVSFLRAQQCSNGGFRLNLSGASCVADPDVTSVAVQALAAAGGQEAAIDEAVGYLATQQGPDGGVKGGSGAASYNANSTGLAAVAFTIAGQTGRAASAESFVASLQYGCAFPAEVRGGIAYDKKAYATMTAAGAKARPAGADTRATAQGILAFTKQPYVAMVKGGAAAAPSITCAMSAQPAATAPMSATAVAPDPSMSLVPAHAQVPQGTRTQAWSTGRAARGPVVNTDEVRISPTAWPFAAGATTVLLLLGGGAVTYAQRH